MKCLSRALPQAALIPRFQVGSPGAGCAVPVGAKIPGGRTPPIPKPAPGDRPPRPDGPKKDRGGHPAALQDAGAPGLPRVPRRAAGSSAFRRRWPPRLVERVLPCPPPRRSSKCPPVLGSPLHATSSRWAARLGLEPARLARDPQAHARGAPVRGSAWKSPTSSPRGSERTRIGRKWPERAACAFADALAALERSSSHQVVPSPPPKAPRRHLSSNSSEN